MTEFRIADTFTDALARLTGAEQKAVKTTAFDLQMNSSGNGLSFHRIDRAKDPNFWSVRVNADIRIIVHRAAGVLLAYVDHHDRAYRWAERRRIEQHPTTGAMQIVELREAVQDIPAPSTSAPRLFAALRKPEIMSFGVPADWVEAVRDATEETLFDVLPHLPAEAAEALLRLAVGEKPAPPPPEPARDAFAHPDSDRRFRVVDDVEALRRALDFPWDRWAVFLHPAQRDLVERRFSGPARVSGSAGTGKTIVALHRAVHLSHRDPTARVLLTTFSKPLTRALSARLRSLLDGDDGTARRLDVRPLGAVAYDLYAEAFGPPNVASDDAIRRAVARAAPKAATFPVPFLLAEWDEVVDARNIATWEEYRDAPRLGRKLRLSEKQRATLWSVFEAVRSELAGRNFVTPAGILARLADAGRPFPYGHVVVDEAQDLGMPEARFLAAAVGSRPDGLFFAGDLGQRIFQQPFSWKSLGLDVRGRSHALRINYRTSHAIRAGADRLLPAEVADVDGLSETRRGTVSVFDGPPPMVALFDDEDAEAAAAGAWIRSRIAEGYAPEEVAVLVWSPAQVGRGRAAAKGAGAPCSVFDDAVEIVAGAVPVGPMHLAKGLEFRAVAVIAVDDEVMPLQERVERATDESALEEVYDTERHLLYVACTRARDSLWVSGVRPGSEFLRDLSARA